MALASLDDKDFLQAIPISSGDYPAGIDKLTWEERGKLKREEWLCSPDDITPFRCSSVAKLAKCIA